MGLGVFDFQQLGPVAAKIITGKRKEEKNETESGGKPKPKKKRILKKYSFKPRKKAQPPLSQKKVGAISAQTKRYNRFEEEGKPPF